MPKSVNGSVPTEVAVHEILRLIIDQNRVRDDQMNRILEQLTLQQTTSMSTLSGLPNLNYTIGNFDGESTDCEVAQEWITALETSGQLNNWGSMCLLEAARSHLTGAARKWYLGRQ